jgi:hypothetical protein
MTTRICCGRSWTVRAYVSHTSHHNRVWPTIEEKFDQRVDRTGSCWVWTGGLNSNGYGTLKRPGGKPRYAHRYSWERENGPIPDGLNVLHKCDNPPCVRPDHLFLGTQKVNGEDMAGKWRSTWGERNAQARLTDAQAVAVANDWRSTREVAEQYGISRSTVSKIRLGRRRSKSCSADIREKSARIAAVERAVERAA